MRVSNFYARKEVREKYEARVKAIKDKYKKLQEDELAALGDCEFSEEDIKSYRQSVIDKYGVGKFEEDGLVLQITTSNGWAVADEKLAVKSLVNYAQKYRGALEPLSIAKRELNKFCDWLLAEQEFVDGVDVVHNYTVTVKEAK